MKFKESDVAWAAGFFDGEGCVQAYYDGRILDTRLCAHNCDSRPIHRLLVIFGGTISEERTSGNRQRIWKWAVSGELSEQVARAMLNYSMSKYDQLEIYLDLRQTVVEKSRYGASIRHSEEVKAQRMEMVSEIKALKRLP